MKLLFQSSKTENKMAEQKFYGVEIWYVKNSKIGVNSRLFISYDVFVRVTYSRVSARAFTRINILLKEASVNLCIFWKDSIGTGSYESALYRQTDLYIAHALAFIIIV